MLNKFTLILISFFILVAAAPRFVPAQETAKEEGWQFNAGLYLWGAGIKGKTAAGGDIDVGFSGLVKHLDFGFMAVMEVRKDKWSFMGDLIYLDVEDDEDVAPGVKTNVELRGWVVTPSVGYNLVDTNRVRFDILGGSRYLSLKSYLDLTDFPTLSAKGLDAKKNSPFCVYMN
jgi:hypothetical protein